MVHQDDNSNFVKFYNKVSKEKARFQVYVLPVPLWDNLCDGTEAPPDIMALLNSNTYEEGGLAYQVHMQRSNDPLSPKAETLSKVIFQSYI